MKNYSVIQPKEHGIYSLGDNIYTEIHIKNTGGVLADPSEVSISITCPHGNALVVDASMPSSSAVGIYHYDYSIPTNTCYGIFKIKIDTQTADSRTYFNFVVFPWDVISRIRELSGAFQQSDMSDYKLSVIAWNAYEETLREIYELHTNEKPCSDPTSGLYLDGVNTHFQVRNYPIADVGGDAIVEGNYDATIHESDLDFYYEDSIGDMYQGLISIVDEKFGIVTLTDLAGNPLSSATRALKITYYSESPTYNQDLMREAVAYLAAHKALIAFKSLDKATLADLQSNRANESQRFLKRYEDLIEQIGFPQIGCGK